MKAARILFALICTVCCLRAQLVPPAPPPPSLTLTNDRLNYYAWLVATQSVEFLLWEGGRNGVRAGESVFIEARTPEWIRDVDLKTSLTGNDLSIAWGFTVWVHLARHRLFPLLWVGALCKSGISIGETVLGFLWNEGWLPCKSSAVIGRWSPLSRLLGSHTQDLPPFLHSTTSRSRSGFSTQ